MEDEQAPPPLLPEHLAEQQRLGRLDKEMEAGTPVLVEGFGEGEIVSYKATWMGANMYTIRFGGEVDDRGSDGGSTQTMPLKDKVWRVVGADEPVEALTPSSSVDGRVSLTDTSAAAALEQPRQDAGGLAPVLPESHSAAFSQPWG